MPPSADETGTIDDASNLALNLSKVVKEILGERASNLRVHRS